MKERKKKRKKKEKKKRKKEAIPGRTDVLTEQKQKREGEAGPVELVLTTYLAAC